MIIDGYWCHNEWGEDNNSAWQRISGWCAFLWCTLQHVYTSECDTSINFESFMDCGESYIIYPYFLTCRTCLLWLYRIVRLSIPSLLDAVVEILPIIKELRCILKLVELARIIWRRKYCRGMEEHNCIVGRVGIDEDTLLSHAIRNWATHSVWLDGCPCTRIKWEVKNYFSLRG